MEPTITITKLDAARRQIEMAILLWFDDADPIAIHTLVAAGHRVCHDIVKHRKGSSNFLFNMKFVPPEKQAEYKKLICKAENFFKHSERDPDPSASITFRPKMTEFYLLDAIQLFNQINGKCTHLMDAFYFRFLHTEPRLDSSSFAPLINKNISIECRKTPKKEFLNVFLQARQRNG
jgi:hypothetical protein